MKPNSIPYNAEWHACFDFLGELLLCTKYRIKPARGIQNDTAFNPKFNSDESFSSNVINGDFPQLLHVVLN